jgi:hypothetical protein
MTYNLGKKCSEIVLLAYLIFAIIGTFAVSIGEASIFEHSNKDIIGSGSYFSPIRHSIDLFAENTTTIGKAHGCSNSPLRSGLLRMVTLAGTIAIALYLTRANLKTIKNINIPLAKNQILLKLRI